MSHWDWDWLIGSPKAHLVHLGVPSFFFRNRFTPTFSRKKGSISIFQLMLSLGYEMGDLVRKLTPVFLKTRRFLEDLNLHQGNVGTAEYGSFYGSWILVGTPISPYIHRFFGGIPKREFSPKMPQEFRVLGICFTNLPRYLKKKAQVS